MSLESISPSDPLNIVPINVICNGLGRNIFSDVTQESSSNEKLSTFLRIRPISDQSGDETIYKVIDKTTLYLDIPESFKKICSKRTRFYNFTEIFDSYTSQQTLFFRCCQPLVEDVLSGQNAILFCYGTTSSGKSYTMRGPPENPSSDPGLIPQSLKMIFDSSKFCDEPLLKKSKFNSFAVLNREEKAMEIKIKQSILTEVPNETIQSFQDDSTLCQPVIFDEYQSLCYISFFEIYNDLIYDLLVPSTGGRGSSLSLTIDENYMFYVKDLRTIMASSRAEALKLYSYGLKNLRRNIQETALNKNSSRSHSFFSITLIKFREDQGRLLEIKVSSLTLGDLAGIERLNKTNSSGQRSKEGGNINGSLFQLKQCLQQTMINQKNPNKSFNIPYKNANLTKFLQPYLSGIGRVWMVININPLPSMLGETLGSLELNETASQISINNGTLSIIEESKKRMTQMWLQSSHRWSSFVNKNKPMIPQLIVEEEVNKENISEEANIEELLHEQEGRIRSEVAKHFDELIKDINQEHERQLKEMKQTYEDTTENRLTLLEKNFKFKIAELKKKNDELTSELFTAREANIMMEDCSKEHQESVNLEAFEQIQAVKQENESLKEANLRAKEELAAALELLEKAQVEIRNLEAEISALKAADQEKLSVLSDQLTKANELGQRLEQEKNSLEEALSQALKDSAAVLNQREEAKQTSERVQQERDSLKAAYSEALEKLATLSEQFEEVQKANENLKQEKDSLQIDIIQSQQKLSSALELLEKAKKANEDYEQQIKSLEGAYSRYREESSPIYQEVEEAREAIRHLEKENNTLEEKFSQANQELTTFVEKYETVKETNQSLEDQLKSLKEELLHCTSQLEQIEPLRKEKSALETELSEVKSTLALEKAESKANHEALEKLLVSVEKIPIPKFSILEVVEKLVQENDQLKRRNGKLEEELKDLKRSKISVTERNENIDNLMKEIIEDILPDTENCDSIFITDSNEEDQPVIQEAPKISSTRPLSEPVDKDLPPNATLKPKNILPTTSVKKGSRQITIDATCKPLPDWHKKKVKEPLSPSTDITNAYLARFCPPSSVKKSEKKRKAPKKSEESDYEEDELACFLQSGKKFHKKGQKNQTANGVDEVKIPTKRRRLPGPDKPIDNISPIDIKHEPKTAGGRVLRPRRKITFVDS